MEIALIPPIPHLNLAQGRQHHLVLAHLVQKSKEYQEFYLREAQDGAYIILDNSAHEWKTGQDADELIRLAPQVGASEIVIPDTLFNCEETTERAYAAFEYLSGHPEYSYRWMVVPQGEDEVSFYRCMENLKKIVKEAYSVHPLLFAKGVTLGISKDYEIYPGGLYNIIKYHAIPWADELHADIHILGWGRDLWALRRISEQFGHRIRSVDSAKPFVYALAGIPIKFGQEVPQYPRRPQTYFSDVFTAKGMEIVEKNIKAFEVAALDGRVRYAEFTQSGRGKPWR